MSKEASMLIVYLSCSDEYNHHEPLYCFLMAISTLLFMLVATHPTTTLELNQQQYVVTHPCATFLTTLEILSMTTTLWNIFTTIVFLASIIIQFVFLVLNIYCFVKKILISSSNKSNTDSSSTRIYYYLSSVGMNKIIFCLIYRMVYYYHWNRKINILSKFKCYDIICKCLLNYIKVYFAFTLPITICTINFIENVITNIILAMIKTHSQISINNNNKPYMFIIGIVLIITVNLIALLTVIKTSMNLIVELVMFCYNFCFYNKLKTTFNNTSKKYNFGNINELIHQIYIMYSKKSLILNNYMQ